MYASLTLVLALAARSLALPLAARGGQMSPFDPFYTPPSGWQSHPVGSVLNAREFVPEFNNKPLNVIAYQLLYRTESPNGTALATVTTVFKPNNLVPNKLVAYSVPEDADSTACAPSVHYSSGLSPTSDDDLYVIGFLQQGYTVASPDYEGPDSAFSYGQLEGLGVLNGARAALNYPAIGLAKTSQIIGVGYSGGAISNGWAASLAPSYAPDLNFVGFTLGGTPADLNAVFEQLDGSLFAYLSFAGIAGLMNGYSGLQSFVESIATAEGKAAIDYSNQNCGSGNLEHFAFQKFASTQYQSYGADVLFQPTVQNIIQENLMGSNPKYTPNVPVLMQHAQDDEIIPYSQAQTLYNNWCSHGIPSLYFETNIGPAEHLSEELYILPNVLTWVNDRFNGAPAPKGCSQGQTVLPLIDASAAPGELTEVYALANALLTGNIGTNDGIALASLSSLALAAGATPPATTTTKSTTTAAVNTNLPTTTKVTVAAPTGAAATLTSSVANAAGKGIVVTVR